MNLDLDFCDHPKIKRLISRIGYEGVFCLLRLWCHTAKFHKADGSLSNYTDGEIEQFAGWNGVRNGFLQAILDVSLMDSDKKIHDWQDHAGHLQMYHEQAKKMNKARWNSIKESSTESVTDSVTVSQFSSVQNSSEQIRTIQDTPSADADYLGVVSRWNEFAEKNGLAKVKEVTPKRKRHIKVRLKESGFDAELIYEKISKSPFLLGTNDRGWRVDFDFVWCQSEGWVKILEGKYTKEESADGGILDLQPGIKKWLERSGNA